MSKPYENVGEGQCKDTMGYTYKYVEYVYSSVTEENCWDKCVLFTDIIDFVGFEYELPPFGSDGKCRCLFSIAVNVDGFSDPKYGTFRTDNYGIGSGRVSYSLFMSTSKCLRYEYKHVPSTFPSDVPSAQPIQPTGVPTTVPTSVSDTIATGFKKLGDYLCWASETIDTVEIATSYGFDGVQFNTINTAAACGAQCSSEKTTYLVGMSTAPPGCFCWYTNDRPNPDDDTEMIQGGDFEVTSWGGKGDVLLDTEESMLKESTCYVPYTEGPVTPVIDDWKLMLNETVSGEEYSADSFILNYIVGKANGNGVLKSGIRDVTCSEAYNGPAVLVTQITMNEMPMKDYNEGVIVIQMDTKKAKESKMFNSTLEEEGVLTFCVNTELWDQNFEDSSISFTQTVVRSAIDFVAGFTTFNIDSIELYKEQASIIEQTNVATASACICSTDSICDDFPVLHQNSPFSICITPDSDVYLVKEFKSLEIFQDGSPKFSPILDGDVTTSFTEVTPGLTGIVKTRMISAFFEDLVPSDVKITGSVTLDFVESEGGRLLRMKNSVADGADGNARASFKLSASLSKSPNEISPNYLAMASYFLLVEVLVLVFVIVVRKRRKGYTVVKSTEEQSE